MRSVTRATSRQIRHRRNFLRFLAASPLLSQAFGQDAGGLTSAADALSVMDFEPLIHKILPPAHLGYILSGTDDDETLRANREGFKLFQLRPRRLVDYSEMDTKVELFGRTMESPIYICPVGGQAMFHPDAEAAVARAANKYQTHMMLSTYTDVAVEEVARELGRPVMFQLYTPLGWALTEKVLKRAEDAGCEVLVFTVDLLGGRNTETATRLARQDTRNCASCHLDGRPGALASRVMFDGIDLAKIPPAEGPHTWASVERLKKMTKMKVVLKGIVTGDDALLAAEHGADGVVVSNHGGRAEPSARATIESLKEVVDAVGSRMPVMIDGGFRRGSDIFKALAIGARAVGIGRPYIWGLTAFGQAGVERVLEILNAELRLSLRQMGTPSVKQITRASITSRDGRI